MKVYCKYAVIDRKSGFLLSFGERYKDFEQGDVEYHDGRTISVVGVTKKSRVQRKYRYVTIKGVECAIVYWLGSRKGKAWNAVTVAGLCVGLDGQYITDKVDFAAPVFALLLATLE